MSHEHCHDHAHHHEHHDEQMQDLAPSEAVEAAHTCQADCGHIEAGKSVDHGHDHIHTTNCGHEGHQHAVVEVDQGCESGNCGHVHHKQADQFVDRPVEVVTTPSQQRLPKDLRNDLYVAAHRDAQISETRISESSLDDTPELRPIQSKQIINTEITDTEPLKIDDLKPFIEVRVDDTPRTELPIEKTESLVVAEPKVAFTARAITKQVKKTPPPIATAHDKLPIQIPEEQTISSNDSSSHELSHSDADDEESVSDSPAVTEYGLLEVESPLEYLTDTAVVVQPVELKGTYDDVHSIDLENYVELPFEPDEPTVLYEAAPINIDSTEPVFDTVSELSPGAAVDFENIDTSVTANVEDVAVLPLSMETDESKEPDNSTTPDLQLQTYLEQQREQTTAGMQREFTSSSLYQAYTSTVNTVAARIGRLAMGLMQNLV